MRSLSFLIILLSFFNCNQASQHKTIHINSSKKSSIGCYNSHQIDDLGARSQVVSRMFVQFLDNNPKYFELTMEEIMWDLHNEYFKC